MTYPLSHKKKTRPIFWIVGSAALVLILSATCSYVCMAAVISLQPPSETSLLRIPVILSGEGDEALSGLQFDLTYDPAQYTLEALEAGGVTTDAAKEAILSEPVPGTGRILITGFNDNELVDGHVATVVLRPRIPGASAQSLSITQPLATDPFGNSVPLAYSDDFGYPPRPPEKTDARLNEDLETEEEDFSSPSETNAAEQISPDRLLEPASDLNAGESPISGFGNGQEFTDDAEESEPGKSPRATSIQSSAHKSSPPRMGDKGGTLVRSPGGTSMRRPGTTAVQSARASSPSDRSTNRQTTRIPKQGHQSPGSQPAEAGTASPRLALVLPTTTAPTLDGISTEISAVRTEGALRTHENTYGMLGAVVLFCLFFLGFSILHVRTFQWLSGAKRRATS